MIFGRLFFNSLIINSCFSTIYIKCRLGFIYPDGSSIVNNMKEYIFEYTKGVGVLLLASFGTMGLSVLCLRYVLKDAPFVITGVSITCAVAFFLFNKFRIKRTGEAKLSETGFILELIQAKQIAFGDLRYYFNDGGKNGAVFTLGFLNGNKLKITANNNFCNDEMFSVFLADLILAIEKYNVDYNAHIIHLESVFARKKAVYVLILLTVLVIAGYCFTVMPVMIVPIAFTLPLIGGWLQYSLLRKRNKLVDF
ncbi:MAG: hypothetical protein JWQ57_1635 [Mucilaginibacter sp.]|nr:hypothetical protein [Mucilaginibacter sp.]